MNKYVPGLCVGSSQITMSQLMSHTSGLWDITDIRWSLGGGKGVLALADVPAWYRRFEANNFVPGTGWCYNNGGFQLLSIALQEISGRSLGELLKEMVFEHVEMYDTFLRPFDGESSERRYLPGEHSGEGGIVSTVDDLLRWLSQMDNPIIGQGSSWAALKRPMTLKNGRSTGYGLGLSVGSRCGLETIGHSGGGLGATAQMLKVPSVGLDVVVLSAGEGVRASELAYRIVDACVACPGDEEHVAAPKLIGGLFRSGSSGRIVRLYEHNGKQKASFNGGIGHCFTRGSGGTLIASPETALCTCVIRALGGESSPAAILLEEGGRVEQFDAMRVPAALGPSSIEGLYRCGSVDTTVSIRQDGGSGLLEAKGPFGTGRYRLSQLAPSLWAFEPILSYMPWKGILSFDQPDAGFTWMTERTWRLGFSRDVSRKLGARKN